MRIQGLYKRFGALRVLEDFSLEIPRGRFTCLFGPSGCGKTTLLNILSGLMPPDAGSLETEKGMRVACVFQEDRLLPWLSALENVAVAGSRAQADAAMHWLLRMGMGKAAHQLPGTLSGGQRRRVALARALHYGGDVLLLDEPFKGLDTSLKAEVMQAVAGEFAGRTAVLVTHDREEALRLCDEIILLDGPPLRVLGRVTPDTPRDEGALARAAGQMDAVLLQAAGHK